MEKITKVKINPLKGKSYEIGAGKSFITLVQMPTGQYVQMPYEPINPAEASITKPLQPKHPQTPVNQWKPVDLGADHE